MHFRRRRPSDPPFTSYTLTTLKRPRRTSPLPWASIVSAASVLGIAVTAVLVVWNDTPATGAADRAAVVAKPTATPGIPVRKPTEYAPPVPITIAGDGMWLVGKQVKPGIYVSEAGPLCYWERLAGLSGEYVDLIDNGGFRKGPTLVEIRVGDFAFSSQGCAKWERVSDR